MQKQETSILKTEPVIASKLWENIYNTIKRHGILQHQLFFYLLAGQYKCLKKKVSLDTVSAQFWKPVKIFHKNSFEHLELSFCVCLYPKYKQYFHALMKTLYGLTVPQSTH